MSMALVRLLWMILLLTHLETSILRDPMSTPTLFPVAHQRVRLNQKRHRLVQGQLKQHLVIRTEKGWPIRLHNPLLNTAQIVAPRFRLKEISAHAAGKGCSDLLVRGIEMLDEPVASRWLGSVCMHLTSLNRITASIAESYLGRSWPRGLPSATPCAGSTRIDRRERG